MTEWEEDGFGLVDEAFIRRQRNEARRLRKSRWWQRKLAEGRCHYCGREVGAAALTMDHVVPVARGGLSVKNNLVPSCKQCNNEKKSKLLQEWSDDYRTGG